MIKLYSYYRSSCSYRVRIALNLKNLEYDIVPIHLVKDGGVQFSPRFTSINRGQKVPVLDHAGHIVAQSVAIIEYLEALFRETFLYPKTPYDRALCRQLIEIINADIQPLQNLSVLTKLVKEHNFSEDEKVAWIQHWINRGFGSYETLLEKSAGEYSVGDSPTAADCFLIPQVYNAQRFGVDMAPFPTIARINEKCLQHPAFIQAHPDNQPDCP